MRRLLVAGTLIAALASLAPAGGALANSQAPNDFFASRQIRVIIGTDAAGAYDVYARLMAPHFARHLHPNAPTLVLQNMAGAGSMVAMNYLYNVAPKDGTVIGAMNPASLVEPLFNPEHAKYDPRKFGWIGSGARDTEVILATDVSGVTKFDDLFQRELVTGSTGAAAFASMLPRLVNSVIGTRMRVIEGYKGASAIIHAMTNGEVQGYGSASYTGTKNTFPHLLESGKIKVIAQYGLSGNKELADVPLIINFAKTDEEREAFRLMLSGQEVGRPYMAPPGIPPAILQSYRAAFDRLMSDESFHAEMTSRRLVVDPLDAAKTLAIVDGIMNTSPNVVQKVRKILGR
jgi:tripartite-type tricarboxylate transporter receptor subunit TctC